MKKPFYNPIEDSWIFDPSERENLYENITKFRYRQDKKNHVTQMLISDKRGDHIEFAFLLEDLIPNRISRFKARDIVYRTDRFGREWYYQIMDVPVLCDNYTYKKVINAVSIEKHGNRYLAMPITNEHTYVHSMEYIYLDDCKKINIPVKAAIVRHNRSCKGNRAVVKPATNKNTNKLANKTVVKATKKKGAK